MPDLEALRVAVVETRAAAIATLQAHAEQLRAIDHRLTIQERIRAVLAANPGASAWVQ